MSSDISVLQPPHRLELHSSAKSVGQIRLGPRAFHAVTGDARLSIFGETGTGATYMVMELEVRVTEEGGKSDFFYLGWPELLYRPAKVDRVLHDGDQVKLGGSVLTAHLSAGHTKGCTKWTIVGSPNVNAGFRLVNNTKYPRIAEDYSRTFEVLRSLQCAIFLGAHRDYYGLERKFRRYGAEGSSVFIDPDGYGTHVAEREKAFRQEWDRQKK